MWLDKLTLLYVIPNGFIIWSTMYMKEKISKNHKHDHLKFLTQVIITKAPNELDNFGYFRSIIIQK